MTFQNYWFALAVTAALLACLPLIIPSRQRWYSTIERYAWWICGFSTAAIGTVTIVVGVTLPELWFASVPVLASPVAWCLPLVFLFLSCANRCVSSGTEGSCSATSYVASGVSIFLVMATFGVVTETSLLMSNGFGKIGMPEIPLAEVDEIVHFRKVHGLRGRGASITIDDFIFKSESGRHWSTYNLANFIDAHDRRKLGLEVAIRRRLVPVEIQEVDVGDLKND